MSAGETALRQKEQSELSQREMKQKIIVGSVAVGADLIAVDADRLIYLKEIRSAFRFQVTVKLSTFSRTAANPYGLRVEEVTPIKTEEVKK